MTIRVGLFFLSKWKLTAEKCKEIVKKKYKKSKFVRYGKISMFFFFLFFEQSFLSFSTTENSLNLYKVIFDKGIRIEKAAGSGSALRKTFGSGSRALVFIFCLSQVVECVCVIWRQCGPHCSASSPWPTSVGAASPFSSVSASCCSMWICD